MVMIFFFAILFMVAFFLHAITLIKVTATTTKKIKRDRRRNPEI